MLYQLKAGFGECYCNAFIQGPQREPLLASFYGRSAQEVRSLGAGIISEKGMVFNHVLLRTADEFEVFYTPIVHGKERFTHGLAVSTALREKYVVTTEETLLDDIYYFLMNQYDLPLLREWMPQISDRLIGRGYLSRRTGGRILGDNIEIPFKGKRIKIKDLRIYGVTLEPDQLKEMVSDLLQERRIWISKEEQEPLEFQNMDEYFAKYGTSVVRNLEEQLHPVSGLNGEIDRIALLKTRPYPQQAAMINGVYEYLHQRKKGSVLFVMGTGSGKTIQSSSAAEMLYVGKWLEEHPGKTLADAYEKDGVINYRHIIMCPGHLVEKWKQSLEQEIPYAKPVIINSFKQLVDLRAAGRERKNGKEFYILSKDFCKLSYQKIPATKKMGYRTVDYFRCGECDAVYGKNVGRCPACDSTDIRIMHSRFMRRGMICPSCNRLLYKKGTVLDLSNLSDPEDESSRPLSWDDFSYEVDSNRECYYCGEDLWEPYVKNINTEFGSKPKEAPWIRQTFWANKTKKGKKTYWILRGYEEEARKLYGPVLNEIDQDGGIRKYSPAEFIKKYMKGYFDVFIADEVHKSKGGSTAQGNAFHWLMKSSRYVFGLSGSIAGGVASDLFYLLFRLNPKRMIEHGYSFGNVLKFSQEYGCVEQDFELVRDVRLNSYSRGRKTSTIRTLPGISPKVFSEFLLDSSVFLNITDMSANMPPLYEKIILVKPKQKEEAEEIRQYKILIDRLRNYEREEKVNLASIRNQFAMSYLDKPYGVPPIIDPKSGDYACMVPDYSGLVKNGGLLAKEEKLLEILRQELSENRFCVIYAEYTASDTTNVLPRLKNIIQYNLGLQDNEVVTLRSASPSAQKREEWMHAKAAMGMKVMICNPRLCETGLDFCWMNKGKVYNYPTLIFYQCGYSLFTVWQAAGRSWRLNQREECRTYYLAYEGTVQQAILQILGEKKSATSAIQGKFSADGLSAMAKGIDTQVRIAQIMNEMDSESGNRLQEMFDVIADDKEDTEYGSCRKMKLLSEIISMVEKDPEILTKNEDLFQNFMSFGLFGNLLSGAKEEPGKSGNQAFNALAMNFQFQNLSLLGNQATNGTVPAKKKRRKKKDNGCYFSLLD